MSHVDLHEGVLLKIMRDEKISEPIVQVLVCKKIPGNAENPSGRYRLLISDGKYMISYAMLATQLNDLVNTGRLSNNSVIKINRYITTCIQTGNKVESRRVLVILDLDIIVNGDDLGNKIGDPVTLTDQEIAANTTNSVDKQKSTRPNTALSNSSFSDSSRSNQSVALNNSVLKTDMCHPIEAISPYNNKWVIKGRVMNKGPIRTWSNSKGEGKLFSFEVCDETSEIRVTAFRDEVDKFYDMIQVDKVYFISQALVKLANRQFNNLKSEYELNLSRDSIIQECTEAVNSIPSISYNFVPISTVNNLGKDAVVDIIGVCTQASDCISFQSRAGKALKKREITLVDQSNNSISLTLWGQEAEDFDGSSMPVIALKGAKVNEFMGGKSLANVSMRINPDISEAYQLRGWYDNTGKNMETMSLSKRTEGASFATPIMTFSEVHSKQLSGEDKLDFSVLATVLFIKSDNCVYMACPTETCNKKVIEYQDQLYRCEKCCKDFPDFKYRLLMNVNISDHTGQVWATVFSDIAEKILGKTSHEIGEMFATDRVAAADYVTKRCFGKYLFKCRIKMESYNDEQRMRTVVLSLEPPNSDAVQKYLMEKITEFTGIGTN